MPGRNDARVFLGLGGNQGDPKASMAAALQCLDAHRSITVESVSPLFRTPPWGKTDQPDFLNACAQIATRLTPRALLDECLEVERRFNRVRGERWGPRPIDIDILLFGDMTVDEEGLQVPHPQLAKRAFVLMPLRALSSGLRVGGTTVERLLQQVPVEGISQVTSDGSWWGNPDIS